MTHPIPQEALEHHIGVLGKTGAGKSYLAQGIAEQVMKRGERLAIIDPTDRYWGLRLNPAGDKPSRFEIVIFGGTHADLPLAATHGKALGEIIGKASTPAILSTRHLTVGERTRFFIDFAETLLQKNEGPLHLVIDEAHLFAPQTRVTSIESGKLLHATNNLVSLGRGVGLRIMLLTQRPAKLHKDSLTQVETLVAMRCIAPQDRNAIDEWVADWADDETGKRIKAGMPSLKNGEAWLWSPELDILRLIHAPQITTFDSGKPMAQGKAPKLIPIDLDKVRGQLEVVAKQAIENDPARLKAQIADLQKQLATKPAALAPEPKNGPAYRAGYADGWRDGRNGLQRVGMLSQEALDKFRASMSEFEKLTQRTPPAISNGEIAVPPPPRPALPLRQALVRTDQARAADGDGQLRAGERNCLVFIVQNQRRGTTRTALGIATGYTKSTRNTYLQRLSQMGFFEERDGQLFPTEAGIAALGSDYVELPTGKELRDHWIATLPEGEKRCLEIVITCYPGVAETENISAATGYTKSTRNTYLQKLTTRGLVRREAGGIRASDDLFDDADKLRE